MARIIVRHESGDRFDVAIGGHHLVVDQPASDGSPGAGPTPTEVFVSSLAACVGFFAHRFLARRGVAAGALSVECDFTMAADHSRVSAMDVRVVVPGGIADDLRPALARVVEHCTVHSSLVAAPAVTIALSGSAEPAAG